MRALTLACAAALAVGLLVTPRSDAGAAVRRHLIVYWSVNPFPSIWSVRTDGSHRRRILRTRQNAKRPRLSPDGTWVAFDGASPAKPPLSDFDIQVVRTDGRARRTLTDSSEWDTDAEWSPDGRLIAFERRPRRAQDVQDSVIWVVQSDGAAARPLAAGFSPRWAPDGRRIAYATRDGNLAVLDVATRSSVPILGGPEFEQPAGWSPDGRTILFVRSSEHSSAIWRVAADGSRARRLAAGYAASWSPKGVRIVYTRAWPSSNLYVMNADGTHKHRLARAAAADPDWG